jgi:tetratricopeptide (TPR) repeat protein
MKYVLAAVVLATLGAGGYFILQPPKPAGPDVSEQIPDPTTQTTAVTTTETTTSAQQDTQQQIATLLQQGQAHMAAGRYNAPDDNNALKAFSAVQALDPDNAEARQALLDIGRITQAQKIVQRATELFEQGNAQDSLDAITAGLRLHADNAELKALEATVQAALQQAEPQQLSVDQLLAQARTQQDLGQLFEPEGDNAFASYQQVLRQEPDNDEARQALLKLGRMHQIQALLQRAQGLLEQGRPEESLILVETGLKIAPDQPDLLQLRDQLQAN